MVALHAAEDAVLKHEALKEETNQENQSNPVVQELLLHLVFLIYSDSRSSLARPGGARWALKSQTGERGIPPAVSL